MIKVKIGLLLDSKDSFLSLISKPINASAALKLKRIFFKLRPEWESFEEIKNEKVKIYGSMQTDGKEFKITPGDEKWPEFFKEIRSAYDTEVSVDIESLSTSDLKTVDGKDIDIEPMHLINLDWLLPELQAPDASL